MVEGRVGLISCLMLEFGLIPSSTDVEGMAARFLRIEAMAAWSISTSLAVGAVGAGFVSLVAVAGVTGNSVGGVVVVEGVSKVLVFIAY